MRFYFAALQQARPFMRTSSQHRSIASAEHATSSEREFDVCIVGAGIIGLATARCLAMRRPSLKIAVVEKESRVAAHQSGRNSGVIHVGIYYAPGSLKAKLCVSGMEMAYKYFDEHKIPFKKVGKLIVAVEQEELPRLEALFKRGLENGCKDIEMIEGSEIQNYEPNCKGLRAIWSPHTGIVDWGLVTKSFGDDFTQRGGKIFLKHQVLGFRESHSSLAKPLDIPIKNQPSINCNYAITCGGLYSDRLAALSGCSKLPKIVPFRGEYLLLKPEKRNLVRGNIYPVPDPRLPFLGVHFTPRMNGDIWLGPNAVLASHREGYRYSDVNLADLADALAFRGMQKLVRKYFRFGAGELYRGVCTSAQVKQLQRYVPSLQRDDVIRGPAGVRAQALDESGQLVDDFVFDSGTGALGPRLLHVRNAPSPAATSSLAIAEIVCQEAEAKFKYISC